MRNEKVRNMSKSIYEIRYVAFLDILGFEKIIEQTCKDESLKKFIHDLLHSNPGTVFLNFLREEIGFVNAENPDFRVSSFSDSIVVSASDNEEQLTFILYLCHLFTAMAREGIFFRGAISKGQLHHNNGVIFGPALVRAYKLEDKKAVHPRIILDQELTIPNTPIGFTFSATADGANSGFLPIKKDNGDGHSYINTFGFASAMAEWEQGYEEYCKNTKHANIQLRPRYWRDWGRIIKEAITRNLLKYKDDEHVFPKYKWLAGEYNKKFSHLGEILVDSAMKK